MCVCVGWQEAVLFHGIFSVHLQRHHRSIFRHETRLVFAWVWNTARVPNGLRRADARIGVSRFR